MFQSNKYILPLDFYPRFFVDITETIKLKAQALNCYSHVNNRYNQLFETTISQNRIWGYQSTMNQNEKFAEAFSIIKYVSR
jgi:LmbE family N-acetylglucosaminyl deacetylase